jgi:S1-C subfamily serine protease
MRMTRFPRAIVWIALAAIPFALVPALSAWSIGPLARLGARLCNIAAAGVALGATEALAMAPDLATPAGDVAASDEPGSPPDETRSSTESSSAARSRAERPRTAASGPMVARHSVAARSARPNVFVGPESIQRAIPTAGRPTSSWTQRTPEHPAGLLIQSPGALAGVIQPGDILVEAEGRALSSFEELVVTVKQAYERRVKRLSGRLFRKGDLVPVTVEPGW